MCTCGETDPHVIMERSTADGIRMLVWSDGPVTALMGYRLRGVPLRRPRTPEGIQLARTAARLFVDHAQLCDSGELGPVYAAAEKAAREDGLPGTLRRHLREGARLALPVLSWTVLHADRDGKPVERFARLPRLRWPGLVVWDYCGGPGSKNGRYVLSRRISGSEETYHSTGFAFGNLAALWAHVWEC